MVIDNAKVKNERAAWTATLFTGVEQINNFNRLARIFPHNTMSASSSPYSFPEGEAALLPDNYYFEGQTRNSEKFLQETETVDLIIIEKRKYSVSELLAYRRSGFQLDVDVGW